MAKKNNPHPTAADGTREAHMTKSSMSKATHGATSSYDRRMMRRNMTTGRSVDVTHETAQPSRRRPGK